MCVAAAWLVNVENKKRTERRPTSRKTDLTCSNRVPLVSDIQNQLVRHSPRCRGEFASVLNHPGLLSSIKKVERKVTRTDLDDAL